MSCERCSLAAELRAQWLVMLGDNPPPVGEDKALDEIEAKIDAVGLCPGPCDGPEPEPRPDPFEGLTGPENAHNGFSYRGKRS